MPRLHVGAFQLFGSPLSPMKCGKDTFQTPPARIAQLDRKECEVKGGGCRRVPMFMGLFGPSEDLWIWAKDLRAGHPSA